MQFTESSKSQQIAVLQQVWKRLKGAEWQTINQIADATGMSFDCVDQSLHQYTKLPDFIQMLREKGYLDEEKIDVSTMEMTNQVFLLTKRGFTWGDMDNDPVSDLLELF